MADLAKLVVRLEAESLKYQKELTKAQNKLGKFERSAKQSTDLIKKAFAGLAAGASIAAFNNLVTSATSATAEIGGLAAVANANTEEFQRLAAAANTVGINNEKLSDILKDVNDRVGDFLTTGGGPMVDFFEKIAPRVGVTAEQFARLSGPQALQLYVSSLEKANLTQQEMTFFLEAMASDATALIPLLKDNGAAAKGFADEAQNLGLILSDSAIKEAKEFKNQLGLLDRATGVLKQRIVAEMTPALSTMTGFLIDISRDTKLAEITASAFATVLKGAASAAIAVSTTFANVGRAIGGLAAAAAAAASFEFDRAGTIIDEFTADNEAATAKAEARIKALWSGAFEGLGRESSEASEAARKAAEDAARRQADLAAKFRAAGLAREEAEKKAAAAAKEAAKIQSNAVKSLQGLTESLRMQIDTLGMGETATLKYRIEQGDLAQTLREAGAAGQQYADQLLQLAQRQESMRKDSEMLTEELAMLTAEIEEGRAVFNATRTPLEQYQLQIAKLNTLSHQGAIDQDTYNRAVAAAQDSFDKASEGANQFGIDMEKIGETLGQNLQNSLAEFLFDPFKSGTDGMLKQFSDLLRKMAAEIAAAEIMKFAFGAGGIGSGGGAIGQGLAALGGLFGGARANGGPVNSGSAFLVGERGPEVFVPGTSGTVMNARDTARLGGGGDTNFFISTPDANSFRANRRQTRRAAREIVA